MSNGGNTTILNAKFNNNNNNNNFTVNNNNNNNNNNNTTSDVSNNNNNNYTKNLNNNNNTNWTNFNAESNKINENLSKQKQNIIWKNRRGSWTRQQKNAMNWLLSSKNPINNIQRNKNGKPILKNGKAVYIQRYGIANYLRTLRNINGKPIIYDPSKNSNYYLGILNNNSRMRLELTKENQRRFRNKVAAVVGTVLPPLKFLAQRGANSKAKAVTEMITKTTLGPAYPLFAAGKFIAGGGIKQTLDKAKIIGVICAVYMQLRHFAYMYYALSGGDKIRTTQLVIQQIEPFKKILQDFTKGNANSKQMFDKYQQITEQFKKSGMKATDQQSSEVLSMLFRYLVLVLVSQYNVKNAKNTAINLRQEDYFGQVITKIRKYALNPTAESYNNVKLALVKFMSWLMIEGMGFTNIRLDPKKKLNEKAFSSLLRMSNVMLAQDSKTPYNRYLKGKKLGLFANKFYKLYAQLPAGSGAFKKKVIASLNKNMLTGMMTGGLNASLGQNKSEAVQKLIRTAAGKGRVKITNNIKKLKAVKNTGAAAYNAYSKYTKIVIAGKTFDMYSDRKVLMKFVKSVIANPLRYTPKLRVLAYLLKKTYQVSGIKNNIGYIKQRIGKALMNRYTANSYNKLYANKKGRNIIGLKEQLVNEILELHEYRRTTLDSQNKQDKVTEDTIQKLIKTYDVDVWRTLSNSNFTYLTNDVRNTIKEYYFL